MCPRITHSVKKVFDFKLLVFKKRISKECQLVMDTLQACLLVYSKIKANFITP